MWQQHDPHLRRLYERAVRLPAPVVDAIDLGVSAIHTIRGPRQVGKSTDLKLLAQRAISEGKNPHSILYMSLDRLEGAPVARVAEAITEAREVVGAELPALLLLDEVTAVRNWQTAIKALWDSGTIDRDVVVCTGSSSYDLARGVAERLPGRRGPGQDFLALPQSFGSFAAAVDQALPPSPRLTVAGFFTESGREALKETRVHLARFGRALSAYLRFGGLPEAVSEAAGDAREPSEQAKRVLWDWLVKEVRGKGASGPALEALVERVALSLGSKISWSHVAREMDIPLGSSRRSFEPNYKSVREYVEFLADCYFLLITYFWKQGTGSSSLSHDKKVYFGDPLIYRLAMDLAPGIPYNEAALVENAVALALFRKYEPERYRMESFAAPVALHVWRTKSGGEIDFVCGDKGELSFVEVKYRSTIDRRSLAGITRSLSGRKLLVAAKDSFELGEQVAMVPVGQLLWALG